MGVFLFFVLATVAGTLSTLFWIPEDDLGRGYFQMNALVVLGLQALALAVLVLHPIEPFGASPLGGQIALWTSFATTILYYMAVWRQRWDLCRWPAAAALVTTTTALLLAGHHLVSGPAPLPHRPLLTAASLASSALLLGWSLVAMLLGHWYLVAPGLTFRHLVVFCRVLVSTVALRLLTVIASVAAAATVGELVEPHPLRILTSLQGQGMFFWFRVLWGLTIPLVLALMALHCARRRANQSATGILYVLVVGTFIGEITAYYLALTTGVPT